MRILAIDTATEACSAAVLTETALVGVSREVGRGHAEHILEMVDTVLRQAGMTLAMLDGIAASVGPGSFTGVRIGVSVAQGLAFGAGLPAVGVNTLEALAWPAIRDGATQVLACLDARMGELYWGCFVAHPQRRLMALGKPAVGPAEGVVVAFNGAFQGVGRGFAAYPLLQSLPGVVLAPGASEALPDARDIAHLAAVRLEAGEGADPALLTPLYVRDKVALTEAERSAARQTAE